MRTTHKTEEDKKHAVEAAQSYSIEDTGSFVLLFGRERRAAKILGLSKDIRLMLTIHVENTHVKKVN